MRTTIVSAVTWLVAVVIATAVGFTAIGLVGDVVRGSGPIAADIEGDLVSDEPSQIPTQGPTRRSTFVYPAMTMTAECRGRLARLLDVVPGEGWRVELRENGPDEDVDASTSRGDRVFTVEIYCNRGHPTPVVDFDFD